MNAWTVTLSFDEEMETSIAPTFSFDNGEPMVSSLMVNDNGTWSDAMTYEASFDLLDAEELWENLNLVTIGATDINGNLMSQSITEEVLTIDNENPIYTMASPSSVVVNDELVMEGTFTLSLSFSEAMDVEMDPIVMFEEVADILELNGETSDWTDNMTFDAVFNVNDEEFELENVAYNVSGASDTNGNLMMMGNDEGIFDIDTRNPLTVLLSANTTFVNNEFMGDGGFNIVLVFDEMMDQYSNVLVSFPVEDALSAGLTWNMDLSEWINNTTYVVAFDVAYIDAELMDIDVAISMGEDEAGNTQVEYIMENFFSIDIMETSVEELESLEAAVVYPNPAGSNEIITLDLGEHASDVTFEVFDLSGKVVESRQLNKVTGIITFSTSKLSSGIYFINIRSNEGSANLKFEIR